MDGCECKRPDEAVLFSRTVIADPVRLAKARGKTNRFEVGGFGFQRATHPSLCGAVALLFHRELQ